MIKHTFKVRESEGATQHELACNIPGVEDLNADQRAGLFDKALDSITIDVQGVIRRALGKGVRGEALRKLAENELTARLKGLKARQQVQVVTVDAAVAKLSDEQITAIEASGAIVVNKDWNKQPAEESAETEVEA